MKYSFELFFLKFIFEFIINAAPQGSNSVNSREKYFNTINFTLQLVQWSHGTVVRSCTFFSWRKSGCRFRSRRGYLQFPFFSLSSYFYPSAFYCLFSLLTVLALRDFCENVFRGMLKRNSITALFTNMRILKFKNQLMIAFFAAVNHLNGLLRKQNFTLTGSKGQGL